MPPVEEQVPNSKSTPTKRKYPQEERVAEKDSMQPIKKKKQESVGSPELKSTHKSAPSMDSKKKRKAKGLLKSKQLQKTDPSVDAKTKHKLDKKPKPSGKHSPRHSPWHSPRKLKSEDQEFEQNVLPVATTDQHKQKLWEEESSPLAADFVKASLS